MVNPHMIQKAGDLVDMLLAAQADVNVTYDELRPLDHVS